MRQSGSAESAEERGRELARRMYAEEEGDPLYAPPEISFPDEEDDMGDVYGTGATRNNNYDDAEDDVLNEANDNVEADSMPPEYYDQVDRFLSIPPPTVVSKKSSSIVNLASQKPPRNIFSKGGAMRVLPAAPPAISMKKISAKVDTGTKSSVGTKKKTAIEIDHTLLQEAFAYTDRLVRDSMMEEALPQQTATSKTKDVRSTDHGGAKGSTATRALAARRASDSSSVVYNVMKQSANIYSSSDLKEKKRSSLVSKIRRHVVDNPTFAGSSPESGRGFGVAAVPEEDLRKNAIDFDELVSNFTAGTTLQQLRSELNESQREMNRSRSFIDQLAKEFNIKK